MDFLITAIVFILIFSVLILVHELGHFLMAKRAGIKVEEFGLGLPPRIWGKKKGETIYSINWIPFGGFVRMFGEDDHDKKMLKSKRSFAGKSARDRIKVVVAGVVMNFFLAWLLLTVGFTVGMEPLLTPDEVFTSVSDGTVVLEPGVKVKESKNNLFEAEDTIYGLDGGALEAVAPDKPLSPGTYLVHRDGQTIKVTVGNGNGEGIKFYENVPFPRVAVSGSSFQQGDVVLRINGQEVFDTDGLRDVLTDVDSTTYEVYNKGKTRQVVMTWGGAEKVIVSQVFPETPAEKSGLKLGDIILSVDGKKVAEPQDVIDLIAANPDKELVYVVKRDQKEATFALTPQDGKVGLQLAELVYFNDKDLVFYNTQLVSSVAEIKESKFPFYQAPWEALKESYRLSILTVDMFGNVIVSLVKDAEVPDSVTGPVGIAKMTHVFLQEGAIPLLRFVAILSLSLAVINILPFPALDGGRLFFILVEVVTGRKINQKFETYVHALGYVLLLLLIFAVTFNDIFG